MTVYGTQYQDGEAVGSQSDEIDLGRDSNEASSDSEDTVTRFTKENPNVARKIAQYIAKAMTTGKSIDEVVERLKDTASAEPRDSGQGTNNTTTTTSTTASVSPVVGNNISTEVRQPTVETPSTDVRPRTSKTGTDRLEPFRLPPETPSVDSQDLRRRREMLLSQRKLQQQLDRLQSQIDREEAMVDGDDLYIDPLAMIDVPMAHQDAVLIRKEALEVRKLIEEEKRVKERAIQKTKATVEFNKLLGKAPTWKERDQTIYQYFEEVDSFFSRNLIYFSGEPTKKRTIILAGLPTTVIEKIEKSGRDISTEENIRMTLKSFFWTVDHQRMTRDTLRTLKMKKDESVIAYESRVNGLRKALQETVFALNEMEAIDIMRRGISHLPLGAILAMSEVNRETSLRWTSVQSFGDHLRNLEVQLKENPMWKSFVEKTVQTEDDDKDIIAPVMDYSARGRGRGRNRN